MSHREADFVNSGCVTNTAVEAPDDQRTIDQLHDSKEVPERRRTHCWQSNVAPE